LDEIKLFDGQEAKVPEDLSPEELFQLYLVQQSELLVQLIETNLDIEPLSTKLNTIETALKSMAKGEKSANINRFLSSMTTKKGMSSIFNEGSQADL